MSFSNLFEISGLPAAWIRPVELYGDILKFSFSRFSHILKQVPFWFICLEEQCNSFAAKPLKGFEGETSPDFPLAQGLHFHPCLNISFKSTKMPECVCMCCLSLSYQSDTPRYHNNTDHRQPGAYVLYKRQESGF